MESNTFPGLTTEEVARIAARTTEVHVDAGQPLDYERGIHFLLEGEVEVLLNGRVIRTLQRGEGIGLASALGVEEREGFASRAVQHSHLLAMTRDDLQDVMVEFPEVAIALLKDAMTNVLKLHRRIEELSA